MVTVEHVVTQEQETRSDRWLLMQSKTKINYFLSKGAKSNADEAAVHQEVGDGEQLVRVRAGVPQREDLQVSLFQLHVSCTELCDNPHLF